MRKILFILFLIVFVLPLLFATNKSGFYDIKTNTIYTGCTDSTLMSDTLEYPVDLYTNVLLTSLIDASDMDGDSAKVFKRIRSYMGQNSGPDSLYANEKWSVVDSVIILITSTRDTFFLDSLPQYGHFTVYDVDIKAFYIEAGDTIKSKSYCTGLGRL